MTNGSDQATAIGLAGGVIAVALLETLFDKGILDLTSLGPCSKRL